MRVLVTGNTGFKGTWLSIYLSMLGHEVHGYSLEYHPEGLNYQLDSKQWLSSQKIADVRDKEQLRKTLQSVKPEIVFHLAAQPIVLDSIRDPANTFDINVNGTLNLLEEAKSTSSIRKVLVVTSDKVYDQSATGGKPAHEFDRLGGGDPYSYSKACQDLVAQSFQELDEGPKILIARAGNVLGGFDKGKNRLLPDMVQSIRSEEVLQVRNPVSSRPWQHVLDCVRGYIQFSSAESPPPILNFGVQEMENYQVSDLLKIVQSKPFELRYKIVSSSTGLEADQLLLDSSLAKNTIGWRSIYTVEQALDHALMELEPGIIFQDPLDSVKRDILLSSN